MARSNPLPEILDLPEISPLLQKKWEALLGDLKKLDSAVVAFSGGVDSSFLVYVTSKVLKEKMVAVTVVSAAEPSNTLKNAADFAVLHEIKHTTITINLMGNPDFRSNPPDRCYFCKTAILHTLRDYANEHKIQAVLEGQNIDDLGDYRPGRKAIEETGTLSPLAKNGFTKTEIRTLSKALGLSTWDHPSSPCLATRIPYGTTITIEALSRISRGETYLRKLALQNVRVRYYDELARIEVEPYQFEKILENRIEIINYFKEIGFQFITLDLQGFRSGSMNEGLSL